MTARGTSNAFSNILFAVQGLSPATLTETIWALAHQRPSVIPDHIVVLTTLYGKRELARTLFDGGGWDRLRSALNRLFPASNSRLRFGMAADHIRLFPRQDGRGDLEDITSAEDNQAAADFILRSLRSFTEDPSTRVIASIAGGRKTTSALLTSCMVLLGRSQDRLCHVLVSPPYDSPLLEPLFLFPESGQTHRQPGSPTAYDSFAARLELTELPFVRLRGWLEKEHPRALSTYMSLVRQMQGHMPTPAYYPPVCADMVSGRLLIAGKAIPLSAAEFGLFCILVGRVIARKPVKSWPEIEGDIARLYHWADERLTVTWLQDFRERSFDIKEDARKLAASIRRKIIPYLPESGMIDQLVPSLKSKEAIPYPASKIRMIEFGDVKRRH